MLFYLGNDILQPYTFFHQYKADHALDPIPHLYKYKDGKDGKRCKAAQRISDRHADTPDKNAVKEEGDDGLTARAQRKVG